MILGSNFINNTVGIIMDKYTGLVARVLMAVIFLMSGLSKIGAFEATQAYMEAMGVPEMVSGIILPFVIVLEVGAAVSLIIGWKIRYSAYALAAFTFIAALLFHNNFGDQIQMIMFMKNIAMVGGLLAIAGLPVSKSISLDHKFRHSTAL